MTFINDKAGKFGGGGGGGGEFKIFVNRKNRLVILHFIVANK